MNQKSDRNVLVKLSAPARLHGMLARETFDVPLSDAGTRFMTWWDKVSTDERDAVLVRANNEGICVTEAWNSLRENTDQ